MATTIKTWKETFIHKYKQHGFNYFGWFDDKYEILFKQKLSDDLVTTWFNAYVKLKKPLKDQYVFEGYHHGNIIGCDTSDHVSMSEPEQIEILRDRITATINEHHHGYPYR